MDIEIVRAADVSGQLSPAWQDFARNPKHGGISRVARRGEDALAIGAFAKNLLHPTPRWFEYKLAEGADCASLSPLLESLLAVWVPQEGPCPIHISLKGSDAVAQSWAEANGFRPIMTTHLGMLPPGRAQLNDHRWLRCLADHDSPALRQELANLHAAIYRAQHAWNPPAPLTPDLALSLFMSETELMPEHLWYAVDEHGRPNGVASLRSLDSDRLFDLGWIGILPGVPPVIHHALLLTTVAGAGHRSVLIEVDEADEPTLSALSAAPVIWHERRVRYERPAAM